KMGFNLDGKPIEVIEVKRHKESGFFKARLHVTKGKHRFAAEFLNDFFDPEGPDPDHRDRNLGVHLLEVEGPFGGDATNTTDLLPATYTQIVFCQPNKELSVEECARKIVEKFARRAYRRRLTDEELNRLVRLCLNVFNETRLFDTSIQITIQAILVSPHFLFRVERDRDPNDPRNVHTIADYELATRLSYFLWSTMPDEELFELADRGELHHKNTLRKQVARMLQDPRSESLTKNFGGQWLNLRSLEVATPNQKLFATFNDDLRADMRRETELLFDSILKEDQSIVRFLDADFTFLNERLAKHYGASDIKGDHFRRVSLQGGNRQGVLTHASILTLTSDPTKTSPVKRGKWVLENILGTAPPPPPAQVPALDEVKKTKPEATLKEQLELHRTSPLCASCHREMDPIGLAFENFNAVGLWREADGDQSIDSSGSLPTGERLDGASDLIQILRQREDDFCRHFVRTMLTYAIGRGLEYYDKCAVDEMSQNVRSNDCRIQSVIHEIVQSDPFLMRRGDGDKE
ncbi:MAG: DUF1592 domain-containing protein, partial [Planctomycetes bacterium]|nr:DUF1592 domain-containing protein [Planctomycetota bacterium]